MQRNTLSRTARTGRVLLTLTASVFAGTMAMLPTRYLVSAPQPVSGAKFAYELPAHSVTVLRLKTR